MSLEKKIDAINLIIREKITIDHDKLIFISKLAIQITVLREIEIIKCV